MSRRHVPETPLHALRRARKIVRHMRDFFLDCDPACGLAKDAPPEAIAIKSLGIAVNASANALEGWIDRFATDAPAVFGVKPSSHQPTQKRNNR